MHSVLIKIVCFFCIWSEIATGKMTLKNKTLRRRQARAQTMRTRAYALLDILCARVCV